MPIFTTLINFNGAAGAFPDTGLVADAAGDLFGATFQGGFGTLFEIVKTGASYASAPTTLVSFNFSNGADPNSGLIVDDAGNLLGTTNSGGATGYGTAFEIAKTGGGYATTPTTLFTFRGFNGASPTDGLITDAAGDLFGATYIGEAYGYGTVFEIAKTGGTYASAPTTLFDLKGSYGVGLVLDAAGNLFGTTQTGTVFEIAKTSGGYASTPTTLVNLSSSNGAGDLIVDAAGNLFGATTTGGTYGNGSVFEIAKIGDSYASTPTTLVSFDGSFGAGLILDAAGNLFGTTEHGGAYGDGTVFEIAKTGNGYASAPTTLFTFNGSNGSAPVAGLVFDAAGDLLGTTRDGGSSNDGTVFKLQLAPTVSITGIKPDSGTSASDGITNVANVTVNGTIDVADAGLTVQVYDGTTLVGTTTANASGNWSLAGVTLAQGANSLTAQATAIAGHTGTSAVFTATLDTTPPVLAITAFTPNSDSTTTITGTIDLADAGQTISLYADTTLIGTTTSDAGGNWTFASVSLPVTSYAPTVPTVKATDAAGNSGSSQYVYRYVGPLPPQYFHGPTLNAGDRQYVFGQAENTTVGSGAEQDVYAGGTDRSSTVGGDQNVYGSAYYTSVYGMQRVYGTAAYATIFAGGEQNVYPTGLALDTILEQGAVQVDWGDAFRTTVAGGKQAVAGLADDTIVFSGTQYVEATGIASTTKIDGGGEQDIYGGGQANGTTIYRGNQFVSGAATSTTINDGGEQTIYAPGTATGTTLNAGGRQVDLGTATNTTINGGEQDVGGSATATTISSGRQLVESGGIASSITINSKGEQDVYFGGAASGTTIAGGNQFVYGSANSTTVDSGGFQYVHGTGTHTTINSGGEQDVYADGTATGTTLNASGTQVDWGAANTTTLDGGNQYVYGTASNATILSGEQFVESGAAAIGSAISGTGAQIVDSGGAANMTTISGGDQHVFGTADATTITAGGTQHVHGVATNTTIHSLGVQKVYADGTANGTTVSAGGTQFVWGVANGTTLTGFTDSAFQYVGLGGIADDTIINRQGIEVAAGGEVHNVTFGGPNASLELEQTSSAFSGVISGWQAQDEIDLGDILFYNRDGSKAGVTLAFTENSDNSGGTLTVSDGSHVASLALLGQYTAASFAVSRADPNGGTVIIDPAHPAQDTLAAAVHS